MSSSEALALGGPLAQFVPLLASLVLCLLQRLCPQPLAGKKRSVFGFLYCQEENCRSWPEAEGKVWPSHFRTMVSSWFLSCACLLQGGHLGP